MIKTVIVRRRLAPGLILSEETLQQMAQDLQARGTLEVLDPRQGTTTAKIKIQVTDAGIEMNMDVIHCRKCWVAHPVKQEDLPITCTCGHVLEAKNLTSFLAVNGGWLVDLMEQEDPRTIAGLLELAEKGTPDAEPT